MPPSFRYSCVCRPSFLHFYAAKFREWHEDVPELLRRETRYFRGDLLHGGRGEVFVPDEK